MFSKTFHLQHKQKVTIKRVLFVGPGTGPGPGPGPGPGQGRIYSNIKDAIDIAGPGDTIRVAEGSYSDTQVTIGEGIRLEGGWNSDFTKRDPYLYPSLLVGRTSQPIITFIDSDIDPNIDSNHIDPNIDSNIDSNHSVIDGFTITHASAPSQDSVPAPALAPALALTRQGTIPMLATLATLPTLAPLPGKRLATGGGGSTTFGTGGSGICCLNSSPTISNCIISGNNAPYGGGIYCEHSSALITRCIIKENSADSGGGGIYWTSDSRPVILNCRFYHNTAAHNATGRGKPDHISMGVMGVMGAMGAMGTIDDDSGMYAGMCTGMCTDLQLANNKDFKQVHFLIYDSRSELGGSVYRLFEKPCGLNQVIGDEDVVIISIQP